MEEISSVYSIRYTEGREIGYKDGSSVIIENSMYGNAGAVFHIPYPDWEKMVAYVARQRGQDLPKQDDRIAQALDEVSTMVGSIDLYRSGSTREWAHIIRDRMENRPNGPIGGSMTIVVKDGPWADFTVDYRKRPNAMCGVFTIEILGAPQTKPLPPSLIAIAARLNEMERKESDVEQSPKAERVEGSSLTSGMGDIMKIVDHNATVLNWVVAQVDKLKGVG